VRGEVCGDVVKGLSARSELERGHFGPDANNRDSWCVQPGGVAPRTKVIPKGMLAVLALCVVHPRPILYTKRVGHLFMAMISSFYGGTKMSQRQRPSPFTPKPSDTTQVTCLDSDLPLAPPLKAANTSQNQVTIL
jgi:hypothetical protein